MLAALAILAAVSWWLGLNKDDGGKDDGDIVPGFYDKTVAEKETTPQATQTGTTEKKEEGTETARREQRMEYPAQLDGLSEQLLRREGYTVSYNKVRKVPNWVAWHLTAAHTNGRYYREGMEFLEDMEVPAPRATDDDYFQSRYDRGHMCPSGDNKWSATAQRQSFLFSNMCPQNHGLNKGDWNDLEIQCRDWAKEMGDLYIVTGPVFYDGVKNTIGRHKVAVPDAFFKVVLADGRKAMAIGFIYPNKGGHKPMTHYVRTVDEVENITGMDFFPMLDDNVEDNVEATDRNTLIKQWHVDRNTSKGNLRSK